MQAGGASRGASMTFHSAALILVAEDDPDIALLVGLQLKRAGYAVAVVETGSAAFDRALELRPSAIVLDLALPGEDGFAVLDRLQSDPRTRGTPVILLSATVQESKISDGLARGATAYVKKPFGAEDLLAAVTAALSPPAPAGPA